MTQSYETTPKSLIIHQVPISTEINSPTVPEVQNNVANEQTDTEAAASISSEKKCAEVRRDTQVTSPIAGASSNILAVDDSSSANIDAGNIQLKRKRKRPKNAYMWFSDAKREEVRAANPQERVGGIAKIIGTMWGILTDEEKKEYNEKAAKDKERFLQEEAEGNYLEEPEKKPASLDLPLSRIKKIMNADPDVNKIQKHAIIAVASATKQFLEHISQRANNVALLAKRKQIKLEDLVTAIYRNPEFDFLRLDFKRGDCAPPSKVRATATQNGKPVKASASKKQQKAAKNTKSITSFFTKQKTSE